MPAHTKGERFGRLTLVRCVGKNRHHKSLWLVRCACGRTVTVLQNSLVSGRTKSCGCLLSETTRATGLANRAHGHASGKKSTEYNVWRRIVSSCTNPKAWAYRYYGGRGLTFTKRWLKFENFLADMGPRPAGHTIDRKDNSKGYCKSNCRWATPKQQANNRRNSIRVTFRGRTQTLSEWCDELKLDYLLVWHRLKYGWSIDQALTKPKRFYPEGRR